MPEFGRMDAHLAPTHFSNFDIVSLNKGTYGEKYEYYTIEVEGVIAGEKVTWKFVADAVNGSAAPAIFAAGALFKRAQEECASKEEFDTYVKMQTIYYATNEKVIDEDTGTEEYALHFFSSNEAGSGIRPFAKKKDECKVILDNGEIEHLRRLANAHESTYSSRATDETAEGPSAELRRVDQEDFEVELRPLPRDGDE